MFTEADDIEVRLVGGSSPSMGSLEVMYNGNWGRICGTGFGMSEALVVCRHIGYSYAVSLAVDARFDNSEAMM